MINISASDPAWSEGGGPRNMKYKGPPMAAIFFMTSFNRDRGGAMAPSAPPPGSAAEYEETYMSESSYLGCFSVICFKGAERETHLILLNCAFWVFC